MWEYIDRSGTWSEGWVSQCHAGKEEKNIKRNRKYPSCLKETTACSKFIVHILILYAGFKNEKIV